MARQSIAIGVMLEGLTDPQSPDAAQPVLFVQGDVKDLSLIAGLTTALIYPWIPTAKEAVSGFGWTSNPRNPINEGSALTVKLRDHKDQLGPLFAEDQGNVVTLQWELADTFVSRTQTAFRVYGTSAPSVDYCIFLDSEACLVTSATPGADGFSYDITVTRGAQGSFAKPHQLRPKAYPANAGDGQYEALYFSSRIDWDNVKIAARIYQFNVTGNQAQSVRTMKFATVSARPRPTGQHYAVTLEDGTKALISHKFGGGRPEVSISHCLQVKQISQGYVSSGSFTSAVLANAIDNLISAPSGSDVIGQQPKKVDVRLTRAEAEYLLGECFHLKDLPWIDATRSADLITRMTPGMNGTQPFQYQVVASAGGWSGSFDLKALTTELTSYFPSNTDPDSAGVGQATVFRLGLQLVETFEGSVSSSPVGVDADGWLDGQRLEGLNAGWSSSDGTAIAPGEDGPKLSLRLAISADFFTTCLYLFASDLGDGTNPGATAYDVIACGFGLGYDMTRIDVGTTPVDGIAPSTGSTKFLELAAMLPEDFNYIFTIDGANGDLGAWLKNEALRALCLWSTEPATGVQGWRQQDRSIDSITTLNPVKGTAGIVAPGTRLQAINAIKVTIGCKGKDLKTEDFRIIRLKGKDPNLADATGVEIRFWKPGRWSAGILNSGAVPRLTSYYFRQLRGSPTVYKVPLSVIQGARKIGDFVQFTDKTLQTASGRGITAQNCQVVGTDNDLTTGVFWVVLMPHNLSIMSTSEGNEAPALKIWHVEEQVAGSQYWLWVDALGTDERATFDITTAFGGIYQILATGGALSRVRVVCPATQNPQGAKERAGWLEAYGRVTQVKYNGSSSKLLIVFDAAWNRGATINFRSQLLLVDRSYVLFTDRRVQNANVEGVEIVLQPEFRVDGDLPLTTYAPGANALPYDQHWYLFIS